MFSIRKFTSLAFLLALASALVFPSAASAESWGKYVNAGVGKSVSITSVTTTNHCWTHSVESQVIGGGNYVGGSQASVSHNWSGNVFASVFSTGTITSHSARTYCPPGKVCGQSTGLDPAVTH